MYYPNACPLQETVKKEQGINYEATRFQRKYTSTTIPTTHIPTTTEDYTLVPSTPLLTSRDIEPADLMTWGEIQGTPLQLDSGSVFKMPDTPRRELLGMKLSENASRKMRVKRSEAVNDQSGNKSYMSSFSSYTPKDGTSSSGIGKKVSTLSRAGRDLLNSTRGGDVQFGSRFGETKSPFVKLK